MITSHGHEDHLPAPDSSPTHGCMSMKPTNTYCTIFHTCSTPISSPGPTERNSANRSSRSSTMLRAPMPKVFTMATCGTSAKLTSKLSTFRAIPPGIPDSVFLRECSSSLISTSPASAPTTATPGQVSMTSKLPHQVRGGGGFLCHLPSKRCHRGRERFLEMLDAYHGVIHRRHNNMLEFLAEPRSVDEMVKHRFVYRPHVEMSFCDSIEKRTAELHLARMIERGEAAEVDAGRYQRTG